MSTSPRRPARRPPRRWSRGWADAVWDMGRDFGTIGCRKGDWTIEITTYRSERVRPRAPASPRWPTATRSRETWDAGTSPSTRWRCRCPSWPFVDPFGGLVDLAHRVLRTPGRPEDSFSDDPLRMMRAARFAAQLGFSVDPDVVRAMTDMAERITIVSAERVRDELVKLVCAPYPRLGTDPARGRPGWPSTSARAARRSRWSATSTTGTRTSTSTRSRCWSRRSRWRSGCPVRRPTS